MCYIIHGELFGSPKFLITFMNLGTNMIGNSLCIINDAPQVNGK